MAANQSEGQPEIQMTEVEGEEEKDNELKTESRQDSANGGSARNADDGLENKATISTNFRDPTANVLANVMSVENLSEQVTLGWRNIDVFVPLPKPSICRRVCCGEDNDEPRIKQILNDVNGVLKSGTLLAVMGASGAGKSTLMNVLAHRNIANIQVTGTVTINGHPVGLDINSMSAYIQQEDLFIGTLTVREHLKFNALLRMERHVSKAAREKRVDEVLLELGLVKCADTVIGTPGRLRGISGGEKKRLSFASEILNDPPLLFADEPTSGLDSFMAQTLVSSLQRLAAKGRTIMCTIHQPSSEVYAMFDSILLLAEGRVAYMGPANEAVEYFSRLGFSCPVNFNPADYFIQTLAVIPGSEKECLERIRTVCNNHAEVEREKAIRKEADRKSLARQESFKDDAYVVRQSPYRASWCRQFWAVLWRCFVSNSREVLVTRIRIFQSLVTGLIAGLIYLGTDFTADEIVNVSGVLFFLTTSASFSSLQGVLFTFPIELPVFLREHKTGMYRTDVYFLAKTLAELPIFLVSPLLLVVVSYWMIGLKDDFLTFLVFFGIVVLITNVAVSFGYVISTMAPTVQAATSIGPPLMLPLLIFGGFFLKNTTVPVYFIWLKYLSWFKYGFEALIINQFHGTDIKCPPGNTTRCFPSGDHYIDSLGFDKDEMMTDIYAMLALFAGFRIVSFIFLLMKAYRKH